jgi:hypothetical protein
MNCTEIKNQVQADYATVDKSGLKVALALTKMTKNLHTKLALFIASSIVPFAIGFVFYFSQSDSLNLKFFVAAMIGHLVAFKVFSLFMRESLQKTYEEQSCIQEAMEELLKTK